MKILAVSNWKGGCGKTTTAVNLAAGLIIRGKKVLVVDNDPQANATINLLPEDTKVIDTVKSLYQGVPVKDTIYQSVIPGLDIIPSNMPLATLELDLAARSDNFTFLKKAINPHTVSDYDYVIIDTSPSLGLLVSNALMSVEGLIIPIHDYYSIEGIAQYRYVIESFAKDNKNLKIDSIVMTQVESNTVLAREIREVVEEAFGDIVCKTNIPKSVKFKEAPSHKKSIYDYAPGTRAAVQHMKLVDELLNKWEA